MPLFHCGVEGGATKTVVVILSEDGKVLCEKQTGPSNAHVIGFDEAAGVILEAVHTLVRELTGADPCSLTEPPLATLSLSLSGMDFEPDQKRLRESIRKASPNLCPLYYPPSKNEHSSSSAHGDNATSHHSPDSIDSIDSTTSHNENNNESIDAIHITTDVIGSIFTYSPRGGCMVIAGTGSAAMVVGEDGKSRMRAGGWGHLIGDDGSAFWIARRTVKEVFREMDGYPNHGNDATAGFTTDGSNVHGNDSGDDGGGGGFEIASPVLVGRDTITQRSQRAWGILKDHFGVTERAEMLEHMFGGFDKARFAGLALPVSIAAREGDPLCKEIMDKVGASLARMVRALIPHMKGVCLDEETKTIDICTVGSVWKSFDLFKETFVRGLRPWKLRILSIKGTSAIGAVVHAAKMRGETFNVAHEDFVDVLL